MTVGNISGQKERKYPHNRSVLTEKYIYFEKEFGMDIKAEHCSCKRGGQGLDYMSSLRNDTSYRKLPLFCLTMSYYSRVLF